ncbi:four helix bundle protein [Bacteroides caecimuris]|jgi:four helix bundle protein|uniref:four helix bundle protein n=1 Tax=Bacteroides caecimuris TaxID=1796613 RepID=UPI0026DFFD15|nr:four helix bundle protein [Bacteroides caecimuris]
MKETASNPIVFKSKLFALKIIKTYKELTDTHKEYVLSKQLLRSGTSIGANVREAIRAQSRPDFISKMSIALKEASESEYWIELLTESDYLEENVGKRLMLDCQELISILTKIIKTAKTVR